MINLLPEEHFKNLHAARQNTLLRTYVFWMVINTVIIVAIFGFVYFLLVNEQRSASKDAESSKMKTAQMAETQKKAKEFQDNLSIAKNILDKEVFYTEILARIGNALPKNAALDSIQLSPAMADTPTTLTIRVKDIQDSLTLKEALQKSKIAKDVNIASVNKVGSDSDQQRTQSQSQSPQSQYPVTVVINLTFTSELYGKQSSDTKAASPQTTTPPTPQGGKQ